jgi:ATP-binding cassette subfamily F protein uup
MALLQLKQISLGYGGPPVLDGVDLQVEMGERVCLLGRNGAGKTSLMRVITGEEAPNRGEVVASAGVVLTRLDQEIPQHLQGSVREIITSGLRPDRHEEDWETEVRIDDLIRELKIPGEGLFAEQSGGVKRRVLLARALAGQPDVLLLDEPTNHLDLDSIQWLESFLLGSGLTLFFVTHDRAFLRKLATRIVELDRGRMSSWACGYDTFLERKAAWLEAEEKQRAQFDKKLAQEEAWLRQGVKARRTRNEGRVRALEAMRAERKQRRERAGTARIEVQEGALSGQKVIEVRDACFAYEGRPILKDFSTTVWRGDKVGIIGPNGAGKTTLLRVLLGQLEPQQGSVRLGSNLQVVYLDQMRGQIRDDKSVMWNVAGDLESVTFQGRARHVHGYLQDFLFEPERSRMPAKMLSGGERNRLLLARLFLQPANVLVLDEPTNDLDAETMELLEELLVGFGGTLLLVSHDRTFLDNVVSSVLVLEGEGRVGEYTGGYADWLQARERGKAAESRVEPALPAKSAPPAARGKSEKPRKFLNRERRELEELPALIEKLEAEQAELAAKLQDSGLYQKQPQQVAGLERQLAGLDERIQKTYARWEELEALRRELEG